MKTVVSVQDLLELEIRPDDLLARYHALTAAEVAERLATTVPLVEVPCPGCGSSRSEAAFEKHGLAYRRCGDCATLYVSPRPSEAALTAHYRDSAPARFWREQVLPATETARLEKIIQPRAQWVLDGLAEYRPQASAGLDVSAHGRALVEEVLRAGVSVTRVIAAHPLAEMDFAPPPDGVDVMPSPPADISALGPVDFVTAFDALDRCADVAGLVRSAHGALRPGGLLFITAPCISGFDLQVLWERSRAILPPDKLNLLSVEGFAALFATPHWNICEFSTPGMFDAETVRRAIEADPDADWPRFLRYLLEKRDENVLMAFQEFLQTSRLSSFARLVVRKAE